MSDQEKLKQIRNILRNVLLVDNGVDNSPRPVKNTTKQECYDALYEIQELLEMRRMDRRMEL